ncbi:P-loop containing nucleoside triphosphate hydrolase protein [Panaeolus papilionaceus]|nr:P-loop containing nucleoside triphosphate hydrolase protein [Panaeolus papilionaceus]
MIPYHHLVTHSPIIDDNAPRLSRLKITGEVSIVPAATKIPGESFRYLIMGPTGAGKSTFIEALAGLSQNLSISKNQLSGYTQSVSAYQVVNVFYKGNSAYYPVYLIDTPGFSDTNISGIEIMDMICQWLKNNELSYFDSILFLTPITETRLPGTRRRTIEMLKAFLKPSNNLRMIIFVTTMWDTVRKKHTHRRSASNFEELREGIFKDFLENDARLSRFMNTRESALRILDYNYWTCMHA